MRKHMNVLFILTALLLCLTGCGGNPAAQVKNFCGGLKNLDYEKMAKCFEEDTVTEEDFTMLYEEFSEWGLDNAFQTHAKNIQYSVGKAVIDEDDSDYAEVEVTMSYDDYGALIEEALLTYNQEFYADETGEVDESRLGELLVEEFAKSSTERIEETVVFYCEKVEGKWVLSYDYDMLERVTNAITCNLMDTYYNFDYEPEDEDWGDLWDDVSDGDWDWDDVSDGDWEELWDDVSDGDWEDASDDTDAEEALYDYYTDRLDSIESSGAMLLLGGYVMSDEDEDEDYYVVTGDIYDYDIYKEWNAIISSVPGFAEKYPDIYDALDNGLWSEEMEVYIPKDASVAGAYPNGQPQSSDIRQLLQSGHAIVYFEDEYGEVYAVYDSAVDYR